jgi:hypothetical protein
MWPRRLEASVSAKSLRTPGTGDRDAVEIGAALEGVEEAVSRDVRVAGEIVAGEIDAVDFVRGAIVDYVVQVHLACHERAIERVGVEADLDVRTGAADKRTRRRRGERGGGQGHEELTSLHMVRPGSR